VSAPLELVAAVKEDGDFDATSQQALRWLDGRHKIMCRRGRWLRASFPLALEDAVDSYALPASVVELLSLSVEGQRYDPTRSEDFGDLLSSRSFIAGPGGLYGEGVSEDGAPKLRVAPMPTEALTGEYTALILPTTLTLAGEASEVKIPEDLEPALIAGAVAEGMLKTEARPDLAAQNEAQFAQGCKELLSRAESRYQGQGPVGVRFTNRRR
jgi:hypothetical protein